MNCTCHRNLFSEPLWLGSISISSIFCLISSSRLTTWSLVLKLMWDFQLPGKSVWNPWPNPWPYPLKITIPENRSCIYNNVSFKWASPVAQTVKNLPAMQETWVQTLGWEWSPGRGHGNPLQYSCLENPHG